MSDYDVVAENGLAIITPESLHTAEKLMLRRKTGCQFTNRHADWSTGCPVGQQTLHSLIASLVNKNQKITIICDSDGSGHMAPLRPVWSHTIASAH